MLNKRLIVALLTIVLLFLGIFSFAQGRNDDDTSGDASVPIITLIGYKEVTIEVGSTYKDAGAKAKDTEDGNLTKKIVTKNPVKSNILGTYKVTYNVKDSDGNAAKQIVRTVKVVDTTKPVITMKGGNAKVEVGGVYKDAGATATDNHDGNLTASIIKTGNVNTNIVGTYTIAYNVSDKNGNKAATIVRTITVVDTTVPVITFGTNGNTNYEKNVSTIVTVTDIGGLKTLRYQWTKSTDEPTEDSYNKDFTSGNAIINPVDVTGVYYLWILAIDNENNKVTAKTNAFHLDNESPVVTLLGDAPYTVEVKGSYEEPGATAIDNIDGDLTAKIAVSGDYNLNTLGEYTITYSVKDLAGNETKKYRTVKVVDTTKPVINVIGGTETISEQTMTTYLVGPSNTDQYYIDFRPITSGMMEIRTYLVSSYGDSVLYLLDGNNVIAANDDYYGLNSRIYINLDSSKTYRLLVRNWSSYSAETYRITFSSNVNAGAGINGNTVEVNTSYTDAGATATDNYDGDITSLITTTNNVDINKIGTYTVNYSVTDSSGNNATATRTVNVVDTTEPTVSFNPNGSATSAKDYNVTVTVADNYNLNKEILKYLWSTQSTGVVESSFDGASSFTIDESGNATISTPSDLDGTYYLWILAKDSEGNTTVALSNGYLLDNTAPIITIGAYNTNQTNQDITVTATTNEGTLNFASHKFTANGSFDFIATDVAGNTTTTTVTINNIDKVNPHISGVSGVVFGWSKTDQTLTISATDNVGVTEYSFDNGTTWQAENTKTFTATTVVNVKVKDAAGNIVGYYPQYVWIDKTLPTITNVTGNPTNWTTGNVTLKVYGNDTESGIAWWDAYSFDDGATWQSSDSKTFSNEGTVKIKVKDFVGNISNATVVVLKIDKSNPVITIDANESTEYTMSNTATGNVVDTKSGLSTVKYVWTTSNIAPNDSVFATANALSLDANGDFSLIQNGLTGTYYLWIQARDNVGRVSTLGSTAYYFDNEAPTTPTVTATVAGNPYSGSWVNQDINLDFNSTDAVSGIEKYQWSVVGSTAWEDVTDPKVINWDLDSNYIIRSIDNAGNISIPSSQITLRRDIVDPAITLALGTDTVHKTVGASYDPMTGVNTPTDDRSGINGSIINDFNPSWLNTADTYTINYQVSDNAGNIGTTARTLIVDAPVDVTGPSVNFITNYYYSMPVSVTINVSDPSGVNTGSLKYLYKHGESKPTEADFTGIGSGSFTNGQILNYPTSGLRLWILSRDNLGNTSIIKKP